MRYGVTAQLTDKSIGIVELAKAVEERGLDSVWLPEHTHIPTSRLTPPPTGDDELAEEYKRSIDPFIGLAAAAAVTTRLRLGTGVALPAQREPIVTAKALATLDQLSGGRFVLGTGFGWNVDEMAHHGVDYATRREHARESVLAMRALWENEEASFEGTVLQLLAELVVAQARAAAAPDPDRRRRRAEDLPAHRRVRAGLDPDRRRRARQVPAGAARRPPPTPAAIRTSSRSSPSARSRTSESSTTTRVSGSPSASSGCPRQAVTSCCRSSTSRPSSPRSTAAADADRSPTRVARQDA